MSVYPCDLSYINTDPDAYIYYVIYIYLVQVELSRKLVQILLKCISTTQ